MYTLKFLLFVTYNEILPKIMGMGYSKILNTFLYKIPLFREPNALMPNCKSLSGDWKMKMALAVHLVAAFLTAIL